MAGFDNDVVYGINADYSNTLAGTGASTVGQLLTNGQIWVGTTAANAGGTNINVLTLTAGAGVTLTQGATTFTIALTGGGAATEHLTGNTGGTLNPDVSNNFNTLGTGSITIVGLGSTLTTQLTGLTANAVLYGLGTATIGLLASGTTGQVLQTNTGAAPTYSTATYPSTTTINQILYSSSANVVGGLATANNGVLITSATGVPSLLAAGTTGQVLTATTGSPPTWEAVSASGTVTSVSVVSANGFAGTVATATTTPAITLTTTITGVLSGNGTAISGSSITQYDVLVGGATNAISSIGPGTAGQILQSGGGAANPAYSTSTYPATNAINTLLYASSANVMSALATANNGVLTTGTTGTPVITALTANGQLIIGSGSGAPIAATLSAGGGISIVNAANSITIASIGGGFTWSETSGAFSPVKSNGYIITTTATATLPASPTEGDTIAFIVNTANFLTITANTGQTIRFLTAVTASAGTAVNVAQGANAILVYESTGTVWLAVDFSGSWTLT